MHFGETLSEERFLGCIKTAFDSGIRTFVTSDVYGNGKADEALGKALKGIPREDYALVGMIGHDFYDGERKGSQGYPRFTDPELRGEDDYEEFVLRATKKSLERCGTDHFDLLMLHNPDVLGYTSEAVWNAMAAAKETGLTKTLGMAPGPANGFTLDLLDFFEKFGDMHRLDNAHPQSARAMANQSPPPSVREKRHQSPHPRSRLRRCFPR